MQQYLRLIWQGSARKPMPRPALTLSRIDGFRSVAAGRAVSVPREVIGVERSFRAVVLRTDLRPLRTLRPVSSWRRLAIPFCRSAPRAREWGIRSICRSPDRTKESARLRVQGVARRNGSDHPAASDLANVRACSANRSATGLSVRFLSVISIVGTVQVGSSIGSTLIHS